MQFPDHEPPDFSMSETVRRYLKPGAIRFNIEHFSSLPSTSDRLRELADAGADEGKVILSRSQTAGRGRLGRSFFSPDDTGIYMSLLLRPSLDAAQAVRITPMSAVAVCEAIEEVFPVRAEIKWVNDVFVGGKKVCGILTECAFPSGQDGPARIIVGVGVNVFRPEGSFPAELQGRASYLSEARDPDTKARLTAEILNRLQAHYGTFEAGAFLRPYRERSCILGREITYSENGCLHRATAVDIDDSCALVVRTPDGAMRALTSGEVQIII